MSDNLNDNVASLKKLLEDEKVVNSIQAIMNMLKTKKSDTPATEQPKKLEDTQHASSENSLINTNDKMDIIMKIKKIYDKINTADDTRINLLIALKPYLNSKRRANIDNAIKMINMYKVSTIMNELDSN